MSTTPITPIYSEVTAENFAKGIEPTLISIHSEILTAPLAFNKQFDLIGTCCLTPDRELEFKSKDFAQEALVIKHVYFKAGDEIFKAEIPTAPPLQFKSKHNNGAILSIDDPYQLMYINVGNGDNQRAVCVQMHVLGYYNPQTGQILMDSGKVTILHQPPDPAYMAMEGRQLQAVGFDLHILPYVNVN